MPEQLSEIIERLESLVKEWTDFYCVCCPCCGPCDCDGRESVYENCADDLRSLILDLKQGEQE